MNSIIKQIIWIVVLIIYAIIMIPLITANTLIGVFMFIGWFILGLIAVNGDDVLTPPNSRFSKSGRLPKT